jgi:hypothetical protein
VIVPERIGNAGRVVPSFQIDDSLAEEILRHKWTNNGNGYLIAFMGDPKKKVYLHRYVYFLAHGYCPKTVDHANRDKLDCRVENLRKATQPLQNLNQNSKPYRRLPRGVRAMRRGGAKPYQARITRHGVEVHIGYFSTPEEASEAYESRRRLAIAEEESLSHGI